MRKVFALSLLMTMLIFMPAISSAEPSALSRLPGHKVCYQAGGIASYERGGRYIFTAASGVVFRGVWKIRGNQIIESFDTGGFRREQFEIDAGGNVRSTNGKGQSFTGHLC